MLDSDFDFPLDELLRFGSDQQPAPTAAAPQKVCADLGYFPPLADLSPASELNMLEYLMEDQPVEFDMCGSIPTSPATSSAPSPSDIAVAAAARALADSAHTDYTVTPSLPDATPISCATSTNKRPRRRAAVAASQVSQAIAAACGGDADMTTSDGGASGDGDYFSESESIASASAAACAAVAGQTGGSTRSRRVHRRPGVRTVSGTALDMSAGTGTAGPLVRELGFEPLVADNNKTSLDARWAPELLDMNVRSLNDYLRTAGLTASDIRELKDARRRRKNRDYAKRSRIKRLAKQAEVRTVHKDAAAKQHSLKIQLEQVQSSYRRLEKQFKSLHDYLLNNGFNANELERVVPGLSESVANATAGAMDC